MRREPNCNRKELDFYVVKDSWPRYMPRGDDGTDTGTICDRRALVMSLYGSPALLSLRNCPVFFHCRPVINVTLQRTQAFSDSSSSAYQSLLTILVLKKSRCHSTTVENLTPGLRRKQLVINEIQIIQCATDENNKQFWRIFNLQTQSIDSFRHNWSDICHFWHFKTGTKSVEFGDGDRRSAFSAW